MLATENAKHDDFMQPDSAYPEFPAAVLRPAASRQSHKGHEAEGRLTPGRTRS